MGPTPLLQPGHNCWRIERAERLQFLIDGSEYFGALRAALCRAQHSIFILGWDIDSRMALLPRAIDDNLPVAFGPFLSAVVARRRELRAHVLSWDYAMLFALEREWLPVLKLDWRTHRRLHFQLDNRHPPGASHHQKVVVIDDRVAFVGGFDITRCRWDTPAHAPADPRRVDADGKPYGPFHDVQMIVEGPVAQALGKLARERWLRATDRPPRLGFHSVAQTSNADNERTISPWPPQLSSALEDVNVAIARTEPAFANHAAITEIRQFYSDAIAAAQRYIFLENQYFSSSMLAALLAERLAQEQGPEVVVITPQRESGWLEENTMGALRAHIYQDLRERDTQQRFRPYCPIIANDDSDGCLNVHSKVMTVDDELLTVGSANLSNRSMSLDTECNLIIEACGQGDKAAAVRSAIAGLRNRLLAEHLATDAETVAAATDNSLIAAIEKLRGGERTLLPAQPQLHPSLKALVPHEALIDPEQPLEPEYVISQYLPQKDHAPVRGHATLIAIAAIFFGCLAFAWRATPLHDYLDIHTALRFVENLQAQPLTPLWMLLTYLIGGLLVVPVVLLIAVTGMVFGPWLGGLYALSGSLVSAALSYWIGRKLGRGALQRFLSRRLQRVNKQLTQRGLLAVVAIRLMPVAPFTIVNLLAGAAQIRLRDFLLGTAIGMLPGIVMTVIFVDRIAAAMRKPSPGSIVLLVVAIAIIVTITLLIQRWLRGERTEPSQNNSNGKDSAHVSEPPRP